MIIGYRSLRLRLDTDCLSWKCSLLVWCSTSGYSGFSIARVICGSCTRSMWFFRYCLYNLSFKIAQNLARSRFIRFIDRRSLLALWGKRGNPRWPYVWPQQRVWFRPPFASSHPWFLYDARNNESVVHSVYSLCTAKKIIGKYKYALEWHELLVGNWKLTILALDVPQWISDNSWIVSWSMKCLKHSMLCKLNL